MADEKDVIELEFLDSLISDLDKNIGSLDDKSDDVESVPFIRPEAVEPPYPKPESEEGFVPSDVARFIGNAISLPARTLAGGVSMAEQIYDSPEAFADLAVSFFEDTGLGVARKGLAENPMFADRLQDFATDPNSTFSKFAQGTIQNLGEEAEAAIDNPQKAIVDRGGEIASFLAGAGNAALRIAGRTKNIPKMLSETKAGEAVIGGIKYFPKTAEEALLFLEKQGTSIISGVSPDAYDIIYKAGRQGGNSLAYSAVKAARKGEARPEDIADIFFKVEDALIEKRGDDYVERFGELKLKDPNNPLSPKELFGEINNILKENWDLQIGFGRKKLEGTGKMGSGVILRMTPDVTQRLFTDGEIKTVQHALDGLVQAILTGNSTIKNMDSLKKKFFGTMNSKRKNPQLKALKEQLSFAVRKQLNDRIDGYEEMTDEYHKMTKTLDEIAEHFKTGSTTHERINAMMRVIRENPATSRARVVLKDIDDTFGVNIEASIAGLETSVFTPKGLVGRAVGIGALREMMEGSLKFFAIFPLTSPRQASAVLGGLGMTSKAVDDAFSHVWKFAKNHGLVDKADIAIEGLNYADVIRMMGMSAAEIETEKQAITKRNELRKALANSGLPDDMQNMMLRGASQDVTQAR